MREKRDNQLKKFKKGIEHVHIVMVEDVYAVRVEHGHIMKLS